MESFKTAFENLKYGLFAPDYTRDPKLLAQRKLFWAKGLCFLVGMTVIPSYNIPEIIFRNPFTVADEIKLDRTIELAEIRFEQGDYYTQLRGNCETSIRQNWSYAYSAPMVGRDGTVDPRYHDNVKQCLAHYSQSIQANMDAVSPWKILTAQSLAALMVAATAGMGLGAINHAKRAHDRARALKL